METTNETLKMTTENFFMKRREYKVMFGNKPFITNYKV